MEKILNYVAAQNPANLKIKISTLVLSKTKFDDDSILDHYPLKYKGSSSLFINFDWKVSTTENEEKTIKSYFKLRNVGMKNGLYCLRGTLTQNDNGLE